MVRRFYVEDLTKGSCTRCAWWNFPSGTMSLWEGTPKTNAAVNGVESAIYRNVVSSEADESEWKGLEIIPNVIAVDLLAKEGFTDRNGKVITTLCCARKPRTLVAK